LCSKEKGLIVQSGKGTGEGDGREGGIEGQGKRAVQLGEGEPLIDRKSFDSNALQCFGISRLSISKAYLIEGSMEGKHLIITCSLTMQEQVIQTHALIDCGAMGIEFMDQDFACHNKIRLRKLKEKRQVEVIDGRTIESGEITHLVNVGMNIENHKEQMPMFVTKLEHYPSIL
jgi:hypothetical protein